MAATLEGNTTETAFEKTIEPAEEANMENNSVAIETEQPRAAPSPDMQGQGQGSKVSGGSESVSSESMSEIELGTPVDELVKPEFTKETECSVQAASKSPTKPTRTESLRSGTDKAEQSSLSGNISGIDQLVEEFKAPAPLATPESISKHANIKGASNVKTDDSVKVTKDSDADSDEVDADKEKEDRFAKLAAQIDEFDPEIMYKKPEAGVKSEKASEVVQFSKDINDESLIDDLIKDSESAVCETESNSQNKGETTPQGGSSDQDKGASGKNKPKIGLSLHQIESNDNGEDKSPDGSMSGSTESDGFQEDEVNGDDESRVQPEPAPVQDTKTSNNKQEQNKTESQKTQNTSPTKTGKSKRKEDKSVEHILKALSSLQTTEEKLAALCKKYADLHEEHRILQSSFKPTQRKLTVITREKDQLQTEHTKAVMAKSKLESLCRELQKHNQTIRQESLQRAKEEDEKRKEISQKFQTTIGEIQTQMQENHDRNKQLREENFELANKLKRFIEQSEAREKQVEKVIQHRELEQKLADAKLEQASAILQEEQGRSQKEKELLILQSTEYLKKMQLKDAELTMYKERYEEFQSTIKKSEEMFTKFKTEMDKMGKRCKKLEKDGAQWKTKWEGANRALIEMAEEKTKYDKERGMMMTKICKLESLCRAMQAERQARKVLDSEKIVVQSEMAKLGLETEGDTIPMAPSPTADLGQDVGDGSPVEGATCSVPGPSGEADSDNSCASEQTGITVIQQDTPPDTSQSEAKDDVNNQSDSQNTGVLNPDQSESNSQLAEEESSQSTVAS